MSGTDVAAARAEEQLAAALQHVDTHVVDERDRNFFARPMRML